MRDSVFRTPNLLEENMKLALSGLALLGLAALSIGAGPTEPIPASAMPRSFTPATSFFGAGSFGMALNDKYRGDLGAVLAAAGPDDLVPISVVLREQADRAAIDATSRIRDRAERRAAVIAILKETAADTQGGILDLLDEAQQRGETGELIRAMWIVNVIAAEVTPGVAEQLAARNDVSYLNWDRPVGDEVFPVEPGAFAGGDAGGPAAGNIECGVELMGAPDVWADFNITGRDVVVGIIDTGCCITHPDLVNQIWDNPGELPGNNIDDDNNGYIDDIHGWNHWQNNSNISDGNGHGTHTAGTVCGDGTNGTTTGMAPDCEMMILKFWNDFAGESVVWNCHEYALDNGADVITASIGWPHFVGPDRVMWRMVCENSMAGGIVVVYAAGNEGAGSPPDNVRTPGDVPDMITCGATDCNDIIAGFSSRGPVTWQNINPYNDWPYPPGKLKPTVSAPGVNTRSTSNNCSSYVDLSGTSMATPHIAGAVALMLEANPGLDHWEVKQILKDTAVDRGPNGPDNDYGHGRVNTYAAVVEAMNTTGVPADLDIVEVFVGNPLGGGVADLRSSDNSSYSARSGFGSNLTELHLLGILVTASTSEPSPNSLDLTVEMRHSDPGGFCKLSMLNDDTGNFETVGSFAVGTSDTVGSFNNLDGTRYVDGAGTIVVEMRSVIFVPFLAFNFDGFVDHVQIDVQ